jgi:hypothetical protein
MEAAHTFFIESPQTLEAVESDPRSIEEAFDLHGPSLTSGPYEPNPVEDVTFLREANMRFGRTAEELVTMHNGRHYEVVTGEPTRQRVDVPVVFTTALGTSTNGHNRHTMDQLLKAGYPVVMIGAEGGRGEWPKSKESLQRFMRNLLTIRLAETAENMHSIMNVVDAKNTHTPKRAINIGESRGAMAGMGFKARAERFDREVIYSDLTAATFPTPTKGTLGHLSLLHTLATNSLVVGNVSVADIVRQPNRLLGSINMSPHFLLHVVATLPTLIHGDAGKLAREIDTDAKIHNTFFASDAWCQAEGWNDLFKDHPYVVNTIAPGNHMAIVQRKTLTARMRRLNGLRDELVANGEQADQIDWERVHMAGHLAVAQA